MDRAQELIESIRRTHEAANEGDYDSAIAVAHPDVELITAGGLTKLCGADKLRAWLEPETIEDLRMEPEELEVAGDRVLVRTLGRGRGVGSGIDIEMIFWAVWTFDDDGRVTRIAAFLDEEQDEARMAAGLSD